MISVQPNVDTVLLADVTSDEKEFKNKLDKIANMNSRLSLAYQDLTKVPSKILKKYSNTLKELDLNHNCITYPL